MQEGYFDQTCRSPELLFWSTPWWARRSYTLELFYTHYLLTTMAQNDHGSGASDLEGLPEAYRPDRARASWTYDPHSSCYGKMGIEGGIAKAVAQMDRLYTLASQRNIPLSVGVYPWPQQLLYDSEDSRHVAIWRDWCRGKCRRFFNHFPAMFQYKREHPIFLEISSFGETFTITRLAIR